jgi:hypothetical protein
MASLTPVDNDPFASPASQPTLTPVDHDPFAAAPPDASPSLGQRATELGKGLARGAESFAGDLGQAVMGPFGPQHHLSNLIADLGLGGKSRTDPEYGQQLATATGMTSEKPGYEGAIGEVVGNPASYFGPGGITEKMLMAGASGAGGEAAGEAFQGTPLEGPARIAGSMLAGPAAARAVKPQLGEAQQSLANAGVTQMTPGQLTGGMLKSFEDKMTSIPILGDFITKARGRSIESFNKAVGNQALEPIGETLERGTAAGHDTIQEVHDKLSNAYDHVVPNIRLNPDQQWFQDLRDIYNRNVQMLPEQHQDQFDRIINAEFGRPAPLSGEKAKVIEGNLNRLAGVFGGSADANQQLLGQALGSTVEAMRANMERTNPMFAQELQRINQGYAMYARMRTAAQNRRGSEGVFTPGDLLTAVKRGDRSVGKGSFAMGNALMQGFAEAGQRVLPSTIPDSGTTGRALAGIAAGSGAAYLSPKLAAGVAAASVPYLQPSMAILNRYARPTTGARSAYATAGRGVGTLRPFMTSSSSNPYAPP